MNAPLLVIGRTMMVLFLIDISLLGSFSTVIMSNLFQNCKSTFKMYLSDPLSLLYIRYYTR